MWLSVSMMALARVAKISPRFPFVDTFAFFTTRVLLITEFLLSSDDTASLGFLFAHSVMQLFIAKFLTSATVTHQNRGFHKSFFSCIDGSELFS